MKYYVIAGEASGDLHASNLIAALLRRDPQAQVRGWGGDRMREAGAEVVRHYKETAIMGFLTVVKNYGKVRRNLKACSEDILSWRPDVLILVDYGGFNLRIARMLKGKGIPLHFYISPKIWAWNTGRVHKIKALIDKMFVIFPFEVGFYKQYGYPVTYVGNPLVDALAGARAGEEDRPAFLRENNLPDLPVIALLAGSRSQELKHVLPRMLEMVPLFPGYQFVIAGAPSMAAADYAPYLRGRQVPVVYDQTYRLVQHARAALVTSGTATLETALLNTPQVVCYSGEGGALAYLLFKCFVKVEFISLVNLIAGREVVKELLMQQLNRKNLQNALSAILPDTPARREMLAGYAEIREKLGAPGASDRVASEIISSL